MRPEVEKAQVTNGQSAGKSFAYLLGVYLGDGCVTQTNGLPCFKLNTIDEDFAKATAHAIREVCDGHPTINGPYQDKRFPKSKPQHQLYCGNRWLCSELKRQTEDKRQIPAWIFTANGEERRAFIAGLMDSEGFVAETKATWTNRRFYMGFKSCDVWILDFVRILELTGIRVGKITTEEPRKAHYKRPTYFRIKMQSWVTAGAYFNCSRKQKRVEEWASVGPYVLRRRYPKAILNEHTSGPLQA